MIGKEIKESRPVSLSEVEEILEKEEKKHTLTYEQEAALKHAKKFSLDGAKARKMHEKLAAVARMNPETIIRIIDVRPKNIMLLRQLLIHTKDTLSEEELGKVLAVIKESN